MAREARIIGTTLDVHGNPWDVREYRSTVHGFQIAIGWPQGEFRGRGGRGVAVIPTQALMEYLSATRLRDVAVPIGLTAVKRLRAGAGIRWDWDSWWSARADDLRTMTLQQFCARHGCSTGAASQRRSALHKPDSRTPSGDSAACAGD